MICKYIVALALFVASIYGNPICGRDISCLAKNSQLTFIGEVVGIEETNATDFSAQVRPKCTMFATQEGSQIYDFEYQGIVNVDHFGTHAGGSCNGDTGVIGDTNIYFVYVNASRFNGGERRFGLVDPCYGAFNYTPENAEILNNHMATYQSAVQVPVGFDCPADAGKATTNADGSSKMLDLDGDLDDEGSSGALKYTVNAMTLLIALIALYLL